MVMIRKIKDGLLELDRQHGVVVRLVDKEAEVWKHALVKTV